MFYIILCHILFIPLMMMMWPNPGGKIIKLDLKQSGDDGWMKHLQIALSCLYPTLVHTFLFLRLRDY
jgi:hypothetical protein